MNRLSPAVAILAAAALADPRAHGPEPARRPEAPAPPAGGRSLITPERRRDSDIAAELIRLPRPLRAEKLFELASQVYDAAKYWQLVGSLWIDCGTLEHAAAWRRLWLELLDGPQRRILGTLLDAYPEALTNEELAVRAGYTPGAGHFNNVRGSLRTIGAIEYPSRGYVAVSRLLFPEGLR